MPFKGCVLLKFKEDSMFVWYPYLFIFRDGFIVLLNLLIHIVFSLILFPDAEALFIDFIDGIIDGWTAKFCNPFACPNPCDVMLVPVALIPNDV